jgi:hypothetical protein
MSARAEQGRYSLVIEGGGTINETSFTATGQGEGDSLSGSLSFEVTFSAVREGTDPIANLLGVLILPTGLFGRELDGATNLLTLSDGDFGFRQLLAGEGVAAQSNGKLGRTGDREFTWSSSAEGQVELTRVSEIRPFSVIMLPAGLGKLIETIEWPIAEDDVVRRVYAIRHFTFEPVAQLEDHQLRDVTIESQVDGLSVRLDINSSIRRLPIH